MKIIKTIQNNPYIDSDTAESIFAWVLARTPDIDIDVIHAILKYPADWPANLDLFQYVNPPDLARLRTDPRTFFVFNFEKEGFFPYPYFDVIYFNCDKYNISPDKIIYVTSNLYENNLLNEYNIRYNKKISINVFSHIFFQYKTYNDYPIKLDTPIKEYIDFCNTQTEKYYNNYCLSLSRIRRHHRTLIQFLLSTNDIINQHISISHNLMNDYERKCSEWDLRFVDYDLSAFRSWIQTLPLNPDHIDFNTNKAHDLSSNLRFGTLFELVNETLCDNYNGHGLFYSEKTFKPMYHLQPFIIFGQQHCNKQLENYGFKLYHNVFDYSFDDEPDMGRRCKQIVKEIERITIYLNTLSKKEQLEWRKSCNTIAVHNFQTMLNISTATNKLHLFLNKLI